MPKIRKPDWLKVKIPSSPEFYSVREILDRRGLNTVCKEARCPNMAECFQAKTATFMILGDTCTRNCLYCNVRHGRPGRVDPGEPQRVADAAGELGLKYIVVTSVTRDDLPDGGAEIFSETVAALRREIPGCRIEVLIPDFHGDVQALKKIIAAGPDVINHNIEVVARLYRAIRPEGGFDLSLNILGKVQVSGIVTKSGFMVGLGEDWEDIIELLKKLSAAGCRIITIGQYQQPTSSHWPVEKYYSPEEFQLLKEAALSIGFRKVESGPLVRSSYRAAHIVSFK
ncbi:MAG: lipoyl synthase [Syntrophaceae bacterium]